MLQGLRLAENLIFFSAEEPFKSATVGHARGVNAQLLGNKRGHKKWRLAYLTGVAMEVAQYVERIACGIKKGRKLECVTLGLELAANGFSGLATRIAEKQKSSKYYFNSQLLIRDMIYLHSSISDRKNISGYQKKILRPRTNKLNHVLGRFWVRNFKFQLGTLNSNWI